MIIQSHRGAGNLAPENTKESFELGWQIGCIPEADVRVSCDGVIVAFHDDDFTRLAPDAPEAIRGLPIQQLTWDQIKDLDVGSYKGEQFRGQRIPKLSDVFAAMAGRPERQLYVDFKYISLDQLAELSREHGVTSQILLASTVYQHLLDWMALCPESGTLLWMGGTEEELRECISALKANDFKAITHLQIHVYTSEDGSFSPSPEFLREVGQEIKPRGILFQSLPWGAADVDIYHRLMDLGVESFASDEPLVTLEAARTYRG